MLLAVGLLALAPRLMWASMRHPPLFSDPEDYHNCAAGLLEGRGLIQEENYRAYRPPLYPLFLAAVYWVSGTNPSHAYVAQAFLGALSCAIVFHLIGKILPVSRIPGPGWWPGLVGGLSFACLSDHVFFTGVIMSEVLYVALLLVWLSLLCESRERKGKVWILLSAILHGLMALCRPLALAYLPVPLLLFWWRRGEGAGRSERNLSVLIYLGVVFLTIAPWTVRNGLVMGRFVPISTNGGVNFYIGHHPGYGYWSTGQKERIRVETDLDEVDESRLFFRIGWEYVRSEPRQALADSYLKLEYLFTPHLPPWPRGEGGTDAGFERLWPLTLIRWGLIWGLLALSGAVLAIREEWAGLRFVLGVVACHTAVVILFFTRTRFRIPLEPLLLVLGAAALTAVIGLVFRAPAQQAVAETESKDTAERTSV